MCCTPANRPATSKPAAHHNTPKGSKLYGAAAPELVARRGKGCHLLLARFAAGWCPCPHMFEGTHPVLCSCLAVLLLLLQLLMARLHAHKEGQFRCTSHAVRLLLTCPQLSAFQPEPVEPIRRLPN
jgi:hypothetical protein